MRIKEGYTIKKLGMGHVVVPIGQASMEFNGVIRLNESGAFLWRSIADGADTKDKLLAAMQEHFDDLDKGTAVRDLDEFLDSIAFALE